jgi:anti-sigma factor RsiW
VSDPTRHPEPERLSAYLDGDLHDPERTLLAAHLSGCAACTAALAELETVKTRAARLPARGPEADLWPGIADRLVRRGERVGSAAPAPDHAPRGARRVTSWRGWRVSLGIPQLAAAAVVLMLLGAGGLWLALERTRPAPAPVRLAPVDHTAPDVIGPVALPADFGFARYDGAIAALRQTLESHRDELDPKTVSVVEHNLVVIDRAIAEARRALAADPANPYLNHHLADQMQRKVDLLRQVTALIHA